MVTLSSILDREFHGQRSLAGYRPQVCKESDTVERLTHTQRTGILIHVYFSQKLYNLFDWAYFIVSTNLGSCH